MFKRRTASLLGLGWNGNDDFGCHDADGAAKLGARA
jgi:hypothetical protein